MARAGASEAGVSILRSRPVSPSKKPSSQGANRKTITRVTNATDVPAVYLDWGQPTQRAIGRVTPQALAGHDFAAGSMGPKVEAARTFVLATGQRARHHAVHRVMRHHQLAGVDQLGDSLHVELVAYQCRTVVAQNLNRPIRQLCCGLLKAIELIHHANESPVRPIHLHLGHCQADEFVNFMVPARDFDVQHQHVNDVALRNGFVRVGYEAGSHWHGVALL